MTTTTTTRYAVQQEHLGGQLGNQKWYWTDADFRTTCATFDEAIDSKRAYEKRLADRPNKFVRGYRIVKRLTTVTETVVQKGDEA
jgi:hypothetical protein